MPAVREQAEELAHKMSVAALEVYHAGRFCGWLYGNGVNGHSWKDLIAIFKAALVEGAESAAQETSSTAENLAHMMGISRSNLYNLRNLLKNSQIPLLDRQEKALAFEVWAAIEKQSTYGGADLTWLQNEFVNYEQAEGESETAYNKRTAAEAARIKHIVGRLYKDEKIEKRSRSGGGTRYYATQIIMRPDDPESFDTAVKTFRSIVGSLTIAALEQHHLGTDNSAAFRHTILRLRDEPAAREVLKEARVLLQEFVMKLTELKEEYIRNEDQNAEHWINLNMIVGRVMEYTGDISEESLLEISEIHH